MMGNSRADWIRDEAFLCAWDATTPYTKASIEQGYALWSAVEYVITNNISGCFVDCGAWRGGNTMLMILAMKHFGQVDRDIFLIDSFTGSSPPAEFEGDRECRQKSGLENDSSSSDQRERLLEQTPFSFVRQAIESMDVDMRFIRMAKADVKETLKQTQTMAISLLRLDPGLTNSMLTELEELYPRLSRGGVIMIDDYEYQQISANAMSVYFADSRHSYHRPMLWAIDGTGRAGVKSEDLGDVEITRYDYKPAGMDAPDLLQYFPTAIATNPWTAQWPYLRKHIPHIWRTDSRHQGYVTGYASVEEATALYTVATQFKGRRGLEIGSHYGWTAAHLLAAGLVLDCVDPAFLNVDHAREVAATLDAVTSHSEEAGVYRLWGGYSPDIVNTAATSGDGNAYSFVFIDGDHDGEAPATDARTVLPYLQDDAVVILHDLTSPHVAKALPVLARAGFTICLMNAMQILAIAWRGHVHVPSHVQDPNCGAIFIQHLSPYLEPIAHGQPTC